MLPSPDPKRQPKPRRPDKQLVRDELALEVFRRYASAEATIREIQAEFEANPPAGLDSAELRAIYRLKERGAKLVRLSQASKAKRVGATIIARLDRVYRSAMAGYAVTMRDSLRTESELGDVGSSDMESDDKKSSPTKITRCTPTPDASLLKAATDAALGVAKIVGLGADVAVTANVVESPYVRRVVVRTREEAIAYISQSAPAGIDQASDGEGG